jgi:hypothetical protein
VARYAGAGGGGIELAVGNIRHGHFYFFFPNPTKTAATKKPSGAWLGRVAACAKA